jgi:very-short-patch-repair endonuclease
MPLEILHANRNPLPGIRVRGDGIGEDEAIAYLDMDWEDVKGAVEYDGGQHRTDRRQYIWDIRRLEILDRNGWIVIRVVAGDQPADIGRRVRSALARRSSR